MTGFDLIVRGGFVIDGTGLPRRRVDVGVRDGRVAALAHLDGETAETEIDADGLIVAPGIVDVHTHYDPQITFDPYATVSCFHGVTTVVAGNCGFSVAPCKAADRPFLSGIFAQVVKIPPGFEAPVHSHDHAEVFMVLEGACQFDGEPMDRFDLTVVAAHEPYGFKAGPDGLHFLVVRTGQASFAAAQSAGTPA